MIYLYINVIEKRNVEYSGEKGGFLFSYMWYIIDEVIDMPKKRGKNTGELSDDLDKMKIDYFYPNTTLSDISKKYKLSLNTVYYIARMHKWGPEKKTANEIAFLESIGGYIKKRKKIILEDMEQIDKIEKKVFSQLATQAARGDFRVSDLVSLIKLKHDILIKFGTNKQIVEQTIKEGDTNFNFNISDTELDVKIVNLVKDLKLNKSSENRIKALAKPKEK